MQIGVFVFENSLPCFWFESFFVPLRYIFQLLIPVKADTRPWWDVGQLLTGPIKFGKWDGVFVFRVFNFYDIKASIEYLKLFENQVVVSIIINIFGAVLFLQGGVVVGVSGLLLSMVICFIIIWMGLAAGCSGNFSIY